MLVQGDEPVAGDRHPMGMYSATDTPAPPQDRQTGAWHRPPTRMLHVLAEELQLATSMRRLEYFEEAAAKQL